MSHVMRSAAAGMLFAALCCGQEKPAPKPPPAIQVTTFTGQSRTPVPVDPATQPPPLPPTEPIEWKNSVGIFIGIQDFQQRDHPLPNVDYGADDAVDLAYSFVHERALLAADRFVLILAGRPQKASSAAHLAQLQSEGHVVFAADAMTIRDKVQKYKEKIGESGVVVLSVATHGFTVDDQYVLLSPDASSADAKGVSLDELLSGISVQGARAVLFVDACRIREHAMPARVLENITISVPYAIFSAAVPMLPAYACPKKQNGCFTAAILEALHGEAPVVNGYVTMSTLGFHVGKRVPELTDNKQMPEARYRGLENLSFFGVGGSVTVLGRIESPHPNDIVWRRSAVEVRALQPKLFTTVLVCSKSNDCRNVNRGLVPAALPSDRVTAFPIEYEASDEYSIYAALSADKRFLSGKKNFTGLPTTEPAEDVVYWAGPVPVTCTTRPVIRSPQNLARSGEIINVAGHVEQRFPALAVEPHMTVPLKWIQAPPTVSTDGFATGPVRIGQGEVGRGQFFNIYLLGCTSSDLTQGQQLSQFPPDCEVSVPITVHRDH